MHQNIKKQIIQIQKMCDTEKGEEIKEWTKLSKTQTSAYGWHNAKYPPELRRACLAGEKLRMDRYAYMYYLMSTWYERLTGRKAPCNFAIYRGWKACVRESCICQGFTGEETEKIICAIGTGTQYKREKRAPETVLRLLL